MPKRKSNRVRKTLPQVPSKSALVEIMKDLADATSSIKKCEAKIDSEVADIRAKYASKVAAHGEKVKEAISQLEAYCMAHKEDFKKTRSMDLIHGKVGFRVGAPKVKLKRGIAKKAVGIVKSLGLTQLVRTDVKETLNRQEIIDNRFDMSIMKPLEEKGIQVVQEETFFCEPKIENLAITPEI